MMKPISEKWKRSLTLLVGVVACTSVSAANYTDYVVDTISGRNTMNYHVTAIYSDGTEEDVTSDAVVAYSKPGLCVADSGVITGKQYGAVNLSFSYQDESDDISLVIENVEAERTVSSIVFTPSSLDMKVGASASFTCAAVFQDAHQVDITSCGRFYSSNTSVVKVVGNTATPVGKGTANLLISYKGLLGSAVLGKLPVTVSFPNPYEKNEAEAYSSQSGVQCEDLSATDKNVAFIENGDWVEYESMDFGDNGPTSFSIVAATPNTGGSIKVYADDNLIGTCTVSSTGSWTAWKSFSCKTSLVRGVHKVRLLFSGGTGYLFNINSWRFTPVATSVSSPTIADKSPSYYTFDGINRGVNPEFLPNGIYIRGHRKIMINHSAPY
jgi:hypothetical protein